MKPYLFALATIALWSTLAFLVLGLSSVPPFLLVGISLTIGSLCGLRWIREWKVPLSTVALGVYGLFGYHFCLFMALRSAPPVEANLLNYLWPLLIVVMSPLFLKNYSLGWTHLIAAVLGFSGAFLIVTGGKLQVATGDVPGYIFAVMAALIWASYSLLSKRVAPFSTGAVGLFCLVSGLLSLVCHFLLEPSYAITSHEVFVFLILGLGPMGAAFFLWDKSLKTGDPRIIGSLSYLTPMLSTMLLIVSGHGQFTWITIAAAALIIAGAITGALAK